MKFKFSKSKCFINNQSIRSYNFIFLFYNIFSHYLMDYYQELIFIQSSSFDIGIINTWFTNKLIHVNSFGINLIEVYFFPFIYVFLLITILSIIFCLTYNIDELASFMFYCINILVAGYFFFTDSLTFFFCIWNAFSSFIFYSLQICKNTKMRGSAYLMFSELNSELFLILALLYIFYMLNVSIFNNNKFLF